MSVERFFQVSSAISSLIIVICIFVMIIGIFRSPGTDVQQFMPQEYMPQNYMPQEYMPQQYMPQDYLQNYTDSSMTSY